MKWFFSSLFVIAWALWLGGAVVTLLFVRHLFKTDRNLALSAAPQLFLVFEKYQLVLAAAAVVGLGGIAHRRGFSALVVLIVVAAAIAAVSALLVTPHINHLRLAGEEHSSAFRALHGLSMLMYVIEVAVLLASGVLSARPTVQSVKVPEESGSSRELCR